MTEIVGARRILQEEEFENRAGVSEGTFFRLGEAMNFIMTEQVIPYVYEFAGPFQPISGGEGGILALMNNQDIVGISGRLRDTGASGNSEFDLHYERNGVDQGTILTANLVIPNTVVGPAWFYRNLINSTNDGTAGITIPTFSKTDFLSGDVLRIDCVSNAVSADDMNIVLWIRPR
jgi:hypothetical protein